MVVETILEIYSLCISNSCGTDANQQKLIRPTVRSYTENYRQPYSIRIVKYWIECSALPQSVVSEWLFSSV